MTNAILSASGTNAIEKLHPISAEVNRILSTRQLAKMGIRRISIWCQMDVIG